MERLTPQETKVEAFVLQGLSHAQIAQVLGLSLGAVQRLGWRILCKHGFESKHQLTAVLLWKRIQELEARLGPSVLQDAMNAGMN